MRLRQDEQAEKKAGAEAKLFCQDGVPDCADFGEGRLGMQLIMQGPS